MDWLILLFVIVCFAVTQAVFIWAAVTLRRCKDKDAPKAYWAVMFVGAAQWVIYIGHIGVFVAGRMTGVDIWKHVLTVLN